MWKKDTWHNVGGQKQLFRRQFGSNSEHFKCTYVIRQFRLIYALVFKNHTTAVIYNHKGLLLFFWSSYISIMGQPALRLMEQSLYGASCGSGKENKRMLVSTVPTQIPSADTLLAIASHMTKSVVYGTGKYNLLWVRQSAEGRGRRGGKCSE